MPWIETTRRQYERHNERYSSDVTDEDRAVIFPLLPSTQLRQIGAASGG